MKKYALVSVSNKKGIIEYCTALIELGYHILSTGGTYNVLVNAGLQAMSVADYIDFPHILDGRVKTLHPKIYGGILCDREKQTHLDQIQEHHIHLIDLVIINLYPFEKIIQKENVTLEEAIENIDIGGASMLRAAAKNFKHTIVVSDPKDYAAIINDLKAEKCTLEKRAELAMKAFSLINQYDTSIENYFSETFFQKPKLSLQYSFQEHLRYGENPHQPAQIYHKKNCSVDTNPIGTILHGKAMSYNNYLDAWAGLLILNDFSHEIPTALVIKHGNACGVAQSSTISDALKLTWDGDPISAFGGVVACNQTVDMKTVDFLKGKNQLHLQYVLKNGQYQAQKSIHGKFIEILIAPDFTTEALHFLKQTSPHLRIIQSKSIALQENYRIFNKTLLAQKTDDLLYEKKECVTKKHFNKNLLPLLDFGLIVTKHLKSNAIALVRLNKNRIQLIGMGCGQPNRIDAFNKLAYPKMIENLQREYALEEIKQEYSSWIANQLDTIVLFSDAFFPFADIVEEASRLQIKYIVQPGGSQNDQLSIDACNDLNLSMIFTGSRHFSH